MTYTKDTTRLSVLVVAFLLVGSAFAFLPAFASTGNAATNAVISSPTANGSPPTTVGSPNVLVGAVATAFSVQVTNPASNAYALTSFTVIAPTGWTFSGTATCGSDLTTLGASSTTAVQCTAGTGSGLPPGFTDTISLGSLTGPASAATSPPVSGTFTTLVVDSSGAGSYSGSSFTEWTIASTTVAVAITGSPTTFTAGGSALSVTATLSSGQSGVPLVFSFTNVNYPSSGFTSTLSPSSGSSSSSGTLSTSWTPSNFATDSTSITATIGNSAITGASGAVATVAGAPSKVSFYFTSAGANIATDYLGNSTVVGTTLYAQSYPSGTSEISLALSDAFGNAVSFGAVSAITLTGVGGQFDQAGTLYATLTCGAGGGHFSCSGLPSPLPLSNTGATFVQSSGYGAVGEISATITSNSVQYTGSSTNIVTSTLGTINGVTTNPTGTIAAGSSVVVQDSTNTGHAGYYQQGVPITLNLCTSSGCATTSHYDGKFSNGASSITLTTNSTGGVESLMAVNTTLGNVAIFNATAPAPTNAAQTNMLTAAASAAITTGPGAISTLVINIAASGSATPGPNIKTSVNGSTVYISMAYADAYGNLVGVAPSNQIQISLAASTGALSATNVYIKGGDLSTNATGSFGPILWSLPNTVGTTATLTASANVNGRPVQGTASILTVSAYPSINVTLPMPISGILYAPSAFVTFQGVANATSGSLTTTISTIGYKVGTGGWLSITPASAHDIVWTVPIVLNAGLNTVAFNVTDSAGKTTVSPAYTVLVDNTVPTFSTITNDNGSSTAALTITSSMGDLNATSVQAWANGTAIAASSITVSGTNNPGSSVNYSVSVSGLNPGTWSLKVQAATLAGLSSSTTATITVTHVTSTNAFTFPAPTYFFLGNQYHTVAVVVTNTQGISLTGIVLAVVHNSAGQTLAISTATVTVAAGGSQTAYVVLNLPSGTYSVNVFVWSSSGQSLSAPSTVSITY